MFPLRVLQLISSGGCYGAENMMVQLSLALKRLDCHVVVGVFQNSHRPNTQVAEAARSHGLEVKLINCEGKIDLQTVRRIRDCLVKLNIDVIHTHGYKADVYGYLAARKTTAKLVATCHNWPGKSISLQMYAALDQLLLRNFEQIGAVSRVVQESLWRFGVRTDKVRVIENGIDTEPFLKGQPVLKELPWLRAKTIVGFVGRLVKEKGLRHLMEAAQCLVREREDVAFVLVGEGPYCEELHELVRSLNMEKNVFFLGRRSDLPDIYASFDIFVLPSLGEGMPLTVLEAMAARKPVVATKVGAIPAMVRDEETGLLINAGDTRDLVKALNRLLSEPAQQKEFGQRGFHRVSAKFSAAAMAASYLKLYQRIVERQTGAATLLPSGFNNG